MADKKITELQLRDNVSSDVNFPSDDGIQSYRVTAAQVKEYVLSNGSVTLQMLASSLQQMLVPTGTVLAFAGSVAPDGFLICNGDSLSRTTYAALFSVIGTAHGTASGSTFNLPDYRGRFLRGVDATSGRDPDVSSRTAMNVGGSTGDNVGSIQGHAMQTHTHIQNSHRHNIMNLGAGGSSYQNIYAGASSVFMNGNEFSSSETAVNQNASATGTHAQASSNETRPVNASVNWIIKI